MISILARRDRNLHFFLLGKNLVAKSIGFTKILVISGHQAPATLFTSLHLILIHGYEQHLSPKKFRFSRFSRSWRPFLKSIGVAQHDTTKRVKLYRSFEQVCLIAKFETKLQEKMNDQLKRNLKLGLGMFL